MVRHQPEEAPTVVPPGGMRVLLVAALSDSGVFEAERKESLAGWVRAALDVAERLSAAGAVEVLLYGAGRRSLDTVVVWSVVTRASLAEWVRDWASSPNQAGGVLRAPQPRNAVEKAFDTRAFDRGGHAPVAVGAVLDEVADEERPTLVLFRLAESSRNRQVVREIARADNKKIFWRFFAYYESVDHSMWDDEGLTRGRLLPNVRMYWGGAVQPRRSVRAFTRWCSS
ncbi:VWA domain-containing protein [Streptomyces sp. NPDC059740]|uniref:VWA domain-containing protein n=1 Tax=Streptomyces sp. NPDC059740 TaxID=3346926 RepID=UPI00364ACDCE